MAKGLISTVLCLKQVLETIALAPPLLPTYLQAMVGVAQTKLPTGHHGLQCPPVIPTDEAPAKVPRSPYLHLNSSLMSAAASTESDL